MQKLIYLAGGCFWGLEKYLQNINGVVETEVGYANGDTENPTYMEVCRDGTGHVETVKVLYDDVVAPLPFILSMFFDAINPISVNKQGGDIGEQYRTGIYFKDDGDLNQITQSMLALQSKLSSPVAIEVKRLENYYPAETYHQKYLDKNPMGYCHINAEKMKKAKLAQLNDFLSPIDSH